MATQIWKLQCCSFICPINLKHPFTMSKALFLGFLSEQSPPSWFHGDGNHAADLTMSHFHKIRNKNLFSTNNRKNLHLINSYWIVYLLQN